MGRLTLIAAAALALLAPSTAGANTIFVDTGLDQFGTGSECSLREAVQAANTNTAFSGCPAGDAGPTEDFIDAPPDMTLSLAGANEDANATGDIDITGGGPIFIAGLNVANGAPVTDIDAGELGDRIFDIRPTVDQATVSFSSLNLRDGGVPGTGDGGAIRIADPDADFFIGVSRLIGNDAGGDGGAISFDDAAAGYDFFVRQVEFDDNNADGEGGGLYIDTPEDTNAVLQRSTFVGNTAGEVGGAVYVESAGATDDEPVLQVQNSTIAGNSALLGGGGFAFDFGLAGTIWFDFSTIAGNTTPVPNGGGAVMTDNASQYVLFRNGNVVAGNTAANFESNCDGPGDFDSFNYNLDSEASCFGPTPGANDLLNANPLLAPPSLSMEPGAAQTARTMGLYADSPAIDLVPSGSCGFANGVDQRLISRPQPVAGMCDAGAFEVVGAPPAAPDSDGDGDVDPADNCPNNAGSQTNTDGDVMGDLCDVDDDNDTVLDTGDNCPLTAGVPSNAGCPAAATPAPGTAPAKKCKKKKKKKKKKKGCKKKKKKK